MPYATGTTSTASGLFNAINTFLVSDCGWNLHDNIATASGIRNIYYSAGSSGQEHIYVGFEYGLKDYDANPGHYYWQNQEYPGAHFAHINTTVMQYWNASTNTATSEQTGRTGPWLLHLPSNNATTTLSLSLYYGSHRNNSLYPTSWTDSHATAYHTTQYGDVVSFGPLRYLYGTAQDGTETLRRYDFQYDVVTSLATGLGNGYRVLGATKADGSPCLYLIRVTGTIASPWRRRNLDGSTDTPLANPPAGGSTSYDKACMVWDGKNYIYMSGDEDLTTFYRYDISADSWSTMTALPAAPGTNNSGAYFAYIPKDSSVGIANSWTSDRIYFKRTTAVNTYYYTVNTNTWSASIGTGSTYAGGSGGYAASSLIWNGRDYIYGASNGYAGNYFRSLNLTSEVWTAIDNLPTAGGYYGGSLLVPDELQNQITIDTNGTTYWLFGDLDHLVCVTKDSDNIYRCSYVGIIDSFYSTQRVTTTALASAGTNVSISVSGVFDQLQLNQPLYIYSPSDGGYAESFNYSSSGVNTIVAGQLTHSYSAGSVIGVDPQPVVLLCNNYDAVFLLHGPDSPGVWTNTDNTWGMNLMQNLIPTTLPLLNSSLPGVRGHYQLWPITVGMFNSTVGGTMTPVNALNRFLQWDSQTPPNEARGQLIGMYCVPTKTAPSPVSEDEIQIGNNTFKVFKCDNLFNSNYWNVSIAVGPM